MKKFQTCMFFILVLCHVNQGCSGGEKPPAPRARVSKTLTSTTTTSTTTTTPTTTPSTTPPPTTITSPSPNRYWMETATNLPTSEFLCDDSNRLTTPEDYMKKSNLYRNKWSQVLLGVVIENYSQYQLKLLSFHKVGTYTRITGPRIGENIKVRNATDVVPPYSERMFIQDNQEVDHNGLAGSISWLVMKTGCKPFRNSPDSLEGKRLALTYKVPWT